VRSPKALIEPPLLRWARTSARLTIDELADKIRVDPDLLEAWELGYDRPTVAQLRRLATAVRRPLAVFFLSEPPLDFDPIRDFRRLDAGAPLELSPALERELRRLQELRHSAITLLEDEATDGSPLLTGLPTSSAEALGRALREILNVSWDRQKDWREPYEALRAWKSAVGDLGVLIVGLTGIAVEEARGFSVSKFPLPLIALNTKDSANGRVFTLMHELAHVALHEGGLCEWSDVRYSTPGSPSIEVFCNAVAAEVLLPRGLVESALGSTAPDPETWPDERLKSLARQLNVSEEAFLRRLVSLGFATPQFYASKREQYLEEYQLLVARQSKKKIQVPYERRIVGALGTGYLDMAFSAYYERRISLSDLAGYAGVRVQYLPQVEREAFGVARVPGEPA
jgi:Zn-dependent peptidase ImmA (M78 family)